METTAGPQGKKGNTKEGARVTAQGKKNSTYQQSFPSSQVPRAVFPVFVRK
jgi:hypothetical protein